MSKVIRIKSIHGEFKETICGDVIVVSRPISYLADLDPEKGVLSGIGSIANKILIYPGGVGSTVGSYIIYGLKIRGEKPIALLVKYVDIITLVGSLLADIPLYLVEDWNSIESLINGSSVWMGRGCINDGVINIEG